MFEHGRETRRPRPPIETPPPLISNLQPTSEVKRGCPGAVDVVFPSRAQFRSVYNAGQADPGPTARMFEHGRETRRPRPPIETPPPLISNLQPTSEVKRGCPGAVDVVFPSRARFRSVYDAAKQIRARPRGCLSTGGKHDGRGPR